MIATTIFWICVAVIVFTYAGYPLLLWMISWVYRPRVQRDPTYTPSVSVLVVAFNEEEKIAAKIQNVLSCEYPADKIELIVCSDGSTDRTNQIVRDHPDPRVKLVALERNVGVNEAFAAGAAQATGEVLVLTDTGGMFERDALRKVISYFADPKTGCVNGRIVFTNPRGTAVGAGYRGYWLVEGVVRVLESRLGIGVVIVGAFEAIRRELFFPVPSAYSNDMTVPMAVWAQRYRVHFETDALLVTPQLKTGKQEFWRRVRTATRGFTSLGFMNSKVPIWKHPVIWSTFIAHKLLRWLTWVFMLGAFASNAFLLDRPLYRFTFALQVVLYAMAALGWLLSLAGKRLRVLSLPYYFCLLQAAGLLAFFQALRGKKIATWKPTD